MGKYKSLLLLSCLQMISCNYFNNNRIMKIYDVMQPINICAPSENCYRIYFVDNFDHNQKKDLDSLSAFVKRNLPSEKDLQSHQRVIISFSRYDSKIYKEMSEDSTIFHKGEFNLIPIADYTWKDGAFQNITVYNDDNYITNMIHTL